MDQVVGVAGAGGRGELGPEMVLLGTLQQPAVGRILLSQCEVLEVDNE